MRSVVLDVMGGDGGAGVAVAAASQFVKRHPEAKMILVGQQQTIEQQLRKTPLPAGNYQLVDSPAVLSAQISNPLAIRQQTKTSMFMALELLKQQSADGFLLTAGSTAGLVISAGMTFSHMQHLGFLGVVRGLLSNQPMLVLDLGGVLQVKAATLCHYARIGHVVAQRLFGVAQPRVALLNVGTEPSKGLPAQVEAYQRLQADANLNFIGNLEPHRLMAGAADVVVCDGYSGNIAYKAIAGTLKLVGKLAAQVAQTVITAPAVAAKFMHHMQTALTRPAEFAAGLVVGLPRVVLKVPGRSQVADFVTGLEYGWQLSQSNITTIIREAR